MTWTCRDCEKNIIGHKPEHCAECHETFGGTRAGDMHRAGTHGVGRHCLTPDQMRAKGLTQNSKGYWIQQVEFPDTPRSYCI